MPRTPTQPTVTSPTTNQPTTREVSEELNSGVDDEVFEDNRDY